MDPKPGNQRSRGEKKSKGERRSRDGDNGNHSHQRNHQSDHKERVVRDTVSFTRPTPSSDLSTVVKPVPTYTVPPSRTEKKADQDDDDDGYGDDFEDYDDNDFEDDDEGDVDTELAALPSSRRSSGSSNVPKLSFSSQKEDAEMKEIRSSMESENSQAITRKQNRTPLALSPSPTPLQLPDTKPIFSRLNSREDAKPPGGGGFARSPAHARKHQSGLMGFASKQSIAFAPRIKRLEALKASRVLQMSDDKSVQLNIAPCTPFEFYHRQLFSAAAPINQIGIPVEISCRDMDMNTEEISTADKEMQYVYGDDTSLLNAIALVKERKRRTAGDEAKQDESAPPDSQPLKSEDGDGEGDELETSRDTSGNRLNQFLQASSQLCEDLLQEQANAHSARRMAGRAADAVPTSLFFADSKSRSSNIDEDKASRGTSGSPGWVVFGGDQSEGSNELVRSRGVAAVKFSSLQSHLLMSAHPYKPDDEDDLRPFRGIYCLWSAAMPGAPSVVLEASGQPSCCTFSAAQAFIVVGGTEEGTLHVWDLRENNSLHANRDTIDLRIARGLRKPCYSTINTAPSAADHAAPLLQVEALSTGSPEESTGSAVSSQFISLDSSGQAIIWATAVATSDSVAASDGGMQTDYGLSPWGKVRLVQQKSLRASPSAPLGHSLDLFSVASPGSSPYCLGVVPGNSSVFLCSAECGSMRRVVRYGGSSSRGSSGESHRRHGSGSSSSSGRFAARDAWCEVFSRTVDGVVRTLSDEAEGKSEGKSEGKFDFDMQSSYQPGVTAIAVNNSIQLEGVVTGGSGDSESKCESKNESDGNGSNGGAKTLAPLVLTGRQDGTLDLFRLDSSDPIQSWDLSLYTSSTHSSRSTRHGGDNDSDNGAVVFVQWATWEAPGAFLAATSCGHVFYFDIFREPTKPFLVEYLSTPLTSSSIMLSSCRSKGMSVYLAVGKRAVTVGEGGLAIRQIDDRVAVAAPSATASVGAGVAGARCAPPQWASWAGRTTIGVSPWQA